MPGKTWLDLLPLPDPNMLKRSIFTEITPLPETATRETAVGFLHDHTQMIELNPLVLRHTKTTAPKNATPDELKYMTWYEMTDEIQYIPGTSVRSEVSYKGGFFDLPRGLQTHVFAPGGVDIQAKWSVGGNMPGEPKEAMEMGLEKPKEGLYLREDVDLRCNVFLANFVKRNLKKSHAVLVGRLLEKVEAVERASTHSSRPGTLRSTHSESNLPARRSMQEPNRYNHDSAIGSNSSSPDPPRRSGTHCTCTGRTHLIACPYYSRLYQPPTLYVPAQAAQPLFQSKSTTSAVSDRSWASTPSNHGPPAGSSDVLIQQQYAEYGVLAAAATPQDSSFRPSEVLPEVVASQWTTPGDQYARNSEAYTPEFRTKTSSTQEFKDSIADFENDPQAAKQYYEYQARRTDME